MDEYYRINCYVCYFTFAFMTITNIISCKVELFVNISNCSYFSNDFFLHFFLLLFFFFFFNFSFSIFFFGRMSNSSPVKDILPDIPKQRVGITKYRQLAVSKNIKNERNSKDFPDGWFFNEQNEQEFWDSIEKNVQVNENDPKKELQKKVENQTKLQDSSAQLRTLLSRFDDIEQETLMELSAISDETGIPYDAEPDVIISDAKIAVIEFMDQIKQLADSQERLLASIRMWLSNAKVPSEAEGIIDEIPDTDQVFDEIAQMIKDYTTKTENVTCLHNDISDLWFKKFGVLKRLAVEKDEEIKKLQKLVEVTKDKLAKEKRERKKLDENNPAKLMKQQMDITMKQNEEMKRRIQGMKAEMTQQQLSSSLSKIPSSKDVDAEGLQMLIEEMKIEYEQKLMQLQVELDDQKNISKQQDIDLHNKEDTIDRLRSKLDSKDRMMKDMEASFQKHLELAGLERNQKENQNAIQQLEDPFEDKYYELKLQQENEIRKLHDFYSKKLLDQAENLNKGFAAEKKKIYMQFNKGDEGTSSLIQSITDQCERRVEIVKRDEEEKREYLAKEFNGKLLVLTKQYERRIEKLCGERDIEQANLKNTINYEVKKAEIKMQEQLSLQTNEISAKCDARIEKAQKQVNYYAKQLEESQKQIEKLKKQVISQESLLQRARQNNSLLIETPNEDDKNNDKVSKDEKNNNERDEKKEIEENMSENKDQAKHVTIENNNKDQTENNEERPSLTNAIFVDSTTNMSEMEINDFYKIKYTAQLKNLQDIMEEQKEWELEQMRRYYEKEIQKAVMKNQKEVREKIVNLTEAMNDDSTESKMSILNALSDSLVTMNLQIDDGTNKEANRTPLMPIAEANQRTQLLTQQVENLTFDLVDMKDLRKAYDQQFEKCKALEAKVQLLENLSNTKDNKDIQEALAKVESKMNEQLKQKNELISKLAAGNASNVILSFEWFTIYSQKPQNQNEDPQISEEFQKLKIQLEEQSQNLKEQEIQKENGMDQNAHQGENVKEETHKKQEQLHIVEMERNIEIPQQIDEVENIIEEPKKENKYESNPLVLEENATNEIDVQQNIMLEMQNTDQIFVIDIPELEKPFTVNESEQCEPAVTKIETEKEIPEYETVKQDRDVQERVLEPVLQLEQPVIQKVKIIPKPPAKKHNVSDAEDEDNDDDFPAISSSRSYSTKRRKKTVRRKVRKQTSDATERSIDQSYIPQQHIENEEIPVKEKITEEQPREVIKYVEKPVKMMTYVEKPIEVTVYDKVPKEEPTQQYSDAFVQVDFQPEEKQLTFGNISFFVPPPPKRSIKIQNVLPPQRQEGESQTDQDNQATKDTVLEPEHTLTFEIEEEEVPTPQQDHTELSISPIVTKSVSIQSLNQIEQAKSKEALLETPNESVERKKSTIQPFQRPLPASVKAGDIRLLLDHFRQDLSRFHQSIMNKIASYVPKTNILLIKDESHSEDDFQRRQRMQKEKEREDQNLFRSHSKEELGIPIVSNQRTSILLNEEDEKPVIKEEEEENEYDTDSETEDILNTINSEATSRKSDRSNRTATTSLSNPSLTFEFDDEQYKNDPFAGAVNLLGQSMRYLGEFKDRQDNTYNEMWNSITAFDAYCSASGNQDESLINFLNTLRTQKQDLDEQQSSLYRLFNADEKLLKILKTLKSNYRKMDNQLHEIEREQKESQMSIQKNIINSIKENQMDNQESDEVTRVETLNKLSNSLDLVKNLNLIKTPEDNNSWENLKAEIMSILSSPTKEKVDSIAQRTQDFISSLQVQVSSQQINSSGFSSERSAQRNDTPVVDERKYEQMKKDLKRIRKMRDLYKKQVQDEKDRSNDLEKQLDHMKPDLEEEQDTFTNHESLLKAKIDSLKEMLGPDPNGGLTSGQSSMQDIIQKVKDHTFNMQVLIESTAQERDMWKNKYEDSKELNKEYEEKIKDLQNKIRDLLTQEDEKASKLTDFSKLDLTDSKADLLIQKASKNQNLISDQAKIELEETLAQNKLLYQRNNDLEKIIIQVKAQLRDANDEIDDLKLKNACCVKEAPPLYNKHVGTQCRLISSHPKPQKQQSAPKQVIPNEIQVIQELDIQDGTIPKEEEYQQKVDTYTKEVLTSSQERLLKEKNEKENKVDETSQQPQEQIEHGTIDEEEDLGRISLSSNDGSSNKLMSTSTLLLEMQKQSEERDTFDENLTTIEQEDETEPESILKDSVHHVVHSPLTWQKKKKPTVISPSNTSTMKRKQGSSLLPSKFKNNNTSVEDPNNNVDPQLVINGAVQGRRSLTGTNIPIKPTQNISASTNLKAATLMHPDSKLSNIVHAKSVPTNNNTNSANSKNNSSRASPEKDSNRPNPQQLKGNLIHPIEIDVPPPTRITVFVKEQNKNMSKSQNQSPVISRFDSVPMLDSPNRKPSFANQVLHAQQIQQQQMHSKTTPQTPTKSSLTITNQSQKQQQIQQEKEKRRENHALMEALRRVSQLRDQKQVLSKQLEQKDVEIVSLKAKISDLMLLLHRSKLETIRNGDSAKRIQIRYDNVKQRLEVAIQELASRDEENSRLKRALNEMKRASLPATQHNIQASKARAEGMKLTQELRHKDAMLNATQNMLRDTSKLNPSVKKHLETLMMNTQRSIARINALRAKWKEEEAKHYMGALSALSLLEDSQFKVVRDLIPNYSPFKRSARIDSIISRIGLRPDSKYYKDFYPSPKSTRSINQKINQNTENQTQQKFTIDAKHFSELLKSGQ